MRRAVIAALLVLLVTPASAADTYPRYTDDPYGEPTLRVHLDNRTLPEDANARDYYVSTLTEAMAWWADGGNHKLAFTPTWELVDNASHAHILVQWDRDIPRRADGSNPAGYARFHVNETTGRFEAPTLIVLEMGEKPQNGPDNSWRQYNRETLVSVAAHELGHALGLAHSNDADDVMFPTGDYPGNRFFRSPQDQAGAADRVPLVLGIVAALLLPLFLIPRLLRRHLWRRPDLTHDDEDGSR